MTEAAGSALSPGAADHNPSLNPGISSIPFTGKVAAPAAGGRAGPPGGAACARAAVAARAEVSHHSLSCGTCGQSPAASTTPGAAGAAQHVDHRHGNGDGSPRKPGAGNGSLTFPSEALAFRLQQAAVCHPGDRNPHTGVTPLNRRGITRAAPAKCPWSCCPRDAFQTRN